MHRALELEYFAIDVEEAREGILSNVLEMNQYKVFYVDGWNRIGATAVIRSIAAVLPSSKTNPELCFDRIIFIDCSEWKSKRALQKEIIKELKLDSSVMAILDKKDEDDDFWGLNKGSRDVISSVSAMIYQTLTSYSFMMFFLNGSDEEVDLTRFGIPQFTEFCNNKMIWTFSRRCLTMNNDPFKVDKLRYTNVFFKPYVKMEELTSSEFLGLLRQETAAKIPRIPFMLEIDRKMVEDCYLYDLFLCYNFHTSTKFSWVSHTPNYWICDAIIQVDRANDISNELHREINWKCNASQVDVVLQKLRKHLEPLFLVLKGDDVYEEGPYRWISVTSRNIEVHGMQTIPAEASSFFFAFERSYEPPTLQNRFFEHSSKLGVLVLCSCAFNFASPPFLKCHGLRFLGLDHCTNRKEGETDNHIEWTCLYGLTVLDLRHTDWNEILSQEKMDLMTNIRELCIEGVRGWQYTADLQGRLPNLQRLRVINPTCSWETSQDVDNSFSDKTSMEILDLSGNSDMKNLPISLSKASSLQMLVLDGCDGLENVDVPGGLPASLKSFSFDGYGPASQRTQTVELPLEHFRPSTAEEKDISISKISLEGCTKLDNLFLRGLNNLVELDLSGTAIKKLDFNTMVVQVPRLKRLFLIGCNHLVAVSYGRENWYDLMPELELMCIDTRAATWSSRPSIDRNKTFGLQVNAVVVDARIIRTLMRNFRQYQDRDTSKYVSYSIHITMSPVYDRFVQFEATNKYKISPNNPHFVPAGRYSDVLSMVSDPPMQAFPQPPATRLDRHVEIAEGSSYVESELEGELGYLMAYHAESMYLHDISVHSIIPRVRYNWDQLRWCCVERCPKLDVVFPGNSRGFSKIETFWASDLLMARWIWSKGSRFFDSYSKSFTNLRHLHLRSCPRVQSMLPVWVSSFPSLETLHIINCSDLSHVFILDTDYPIEITGNGVLFSKLTTIHLHDLPKLQQICEVKMVAPNLQSIKIRGCWSLRSLPSVGARARGEKKPTVEIEKDAWDALEWDAGHRPDHFEAPVHSRHYKKKLPRVSFLR